DPNKKALIDFTQSGHTGKSLANVPDDPTSTRYAVSNIDGNRRALIDFTQTGHLSKHLGNIADDPTSTRYAVGAIDGNRRALIDFSQSAHANKTQDYIGDGNLYVRTIQQSVSETVDNASFELPVDAQGKVPGWYNSHASTLSLSSTQHYTGS